MSTIIFQKQDGTIYDLDKMGFRVKKFDPPTTAYNYTYQQIGNYGATLTNVQTQQLVIPLVINVLAIDSNDLFLQRMKLNRLLQSHEPFYVYDVAAKDIRWKVYAETATVSRDNSFWRASNVQINLECPTGYAESSFTTQEFDRASGKGIGLKMGLFSHDWKYTFTNQNDFTFYNAGIIPLTADEHPVTIYFSGDAPNGFTITNKTSGQSLKMSKGVTAKDNVTISGLVPTINDQQQYTAGDHNYLDFYTGENQIHIDGASNFTIKFDTRFYY